MTLDETLEELKNDSLAPIRLSEILQFLVSEYGRKGMRLNEVLKRKPLAWTKLRLNTKSDTSAEREYQATEDGMSETSIRLEMKILEKLMSVVKVRISILQGEARNIF